MLQQSFIARVFRLVLLLVTGGLGLVLPSLGYADSGSLVPDGDAFRVALSANQNANFTFSGKVGQLLGLGITGLSTTPSNGTVSVRVIKPDDTSVLIDCGAFYSSNGGGSCNLPRLTADGVYTVRVEPNTGYAASFNLFLSNEVVDALTLGAAMPFSTQRVGQNAHYTFSAVAGQDFNLTVSGSGFSDSVQVTVLNPDGSSLTSTSFSRNPTVLNLRNLTATGTYSVALDPVRSAVGSLNLLLQQNSSPTALVADGDPVNASLASGQNGDYAFVGTTNELLGLGVTGLTTSPSGGNVSIQVIQPNDNTVLTSCGSFSASKGGGSCNLATLPSAGTYTVRVVPDTGYAANFKLLLSNEVSGGALVSGTTQTFSTTRVGQNADFSFSATAGDDLSLSLANSSFATQVWATISRPDGVLLTQTGLSGSGPRVMNLTNLPATGSYRIFLDPAGTDTGSIDVLLQKNDSNALVANGDAAHASLGINQSGDYTFAGTAGELLGLGVTNLVMAPSDSTVSISVIDPDGVTQHTNCGFSSKNGGGSCNFPALPSDGTYTVRVVPQVGFSANLDLLLSVEVPGGMLTSGVNKNFTTARVGQNANFNFSANAGDNVNLVLGNNTFSTNVYARVIQPGLSSSLYNILLVAGAKSSVLNMNSLPATGTYTISVDPTGLGVGAIDVRVDAVGATMPSAETVDGSLSVDGDPVSVAAGAAVNYTFAGTTGQHLGLGLSSLVTSPANSFVSVQVLSVDNQTVLVSCGTFWVSDGDNACSLPVLPADGTYTIRMTPKSGGYVANFHLALYSDVTSTLAAGTTTTFSTTHVGQNGRYSFQATAGQNFTLQLSNRKFPRSVSVSVLNPNGELVAQTSVGSGGQRSLTLRNLLVTGNYTVFVDPYNADTGSIDLLLQADVTGNTVVVDSDVMAASLGQNQNGDYSFSGVVGQHLGLGLANLNTSPQNGSVSVQVFSPDNQTSLIDCGGFSASNAGDSCNLPVLPASGMYTIQVVPTIGSSANFNLTLSNDVAGTLLPGTNTSFSITRPGQNGRYTFAATAGQPFTLQASNLNFPNWVAVTVLDPNGASVGSFNVYQNSPRFLTLNNLTVTGTYTVFVDPSKTGTGTVNLLLQTDATNAAGTPLVIDGTPLSVVLNQNQNGDFTFTGSVGQHLGLGIGNLVTNPSNNSVSVTVIEPDGRTVLVNCGGISRNANNGGSCNLPVLPADGAYTVQVQNCAGCSSSFDIYLSSDLGATLVSGVPAFFSTTRPGQNGRYIFSASAGQKFNLVSSASTFQASPSISVFNPDGSYISGVTLGQNSSYVSNLSALSQTGIYTVFVDPAYASTGGLNLLLEADATSNALTIDGNSLSTSLSLGQSGDYSFVGLAGQKLGLGISNLAIAPTNSSVHVKVFSLSQNSVLVDCGSMYGSNTGGSCSLPALPADGVYTIQVQTDSGQAASFDLTLSSNVSGVLSFGTASLFSTQRVGQKAEYTFAASAGQNIALVLSGSTFSRSTKVNIYRPDGQSIASTWTSAGQAPVIASKDNLQYTGVYTVVLSPDDVGVGQVRLLLNQTGTTAPAVESVDGVVSVDSDAVNISANKSVNYTFTGSVGDHIGFGLSQLATTPARAAVSVQIIAPDNSTVLIDCGNFYDYFWPRSCELPALPSTGTYTVRITPSSGTTFSISAMLSHDVTSALLYGKAVTFATTRAGQSGRYGFFATAGQDVSLEISGSSFPSNNTRVTVFAPDGSTVQQAYFDANTKVFTMRNLPATGGYSVFVDVVGTSGSVKLKLIADAGNNVLHINADVLGVSLAGNQSTDFFFAGTMGQRLGLGVTGVATSPSGGSISVKILTPDGNTLLIDCGSYADANDGSCSLPVLPVSGNYIVRLMPSTGTTAAAALTLSSYQAVVLTPNNDPVTSTFTRVGQGGAYSFAVKQGSRYTLKWANASFMGTIGLYQTDGSLVQQNVFDSASNSNGSVVMSSASANGLGSVLVTPLSTGTGSVQLNVTTPVAVSVSTSAAQYKAGLPVILNVSVAGRKPSGTVVVSEVNAQDASVTTVLTSGTLVAGKQTFSLSLPAGTHILRADYQGDLLNEGGGYATATVQVGTSEISLTSSNNPVAPSATVTYKTTVHGASPTGTVDFYDNDTLIGTVALSDGTANFSTSYASAGRHTIVAVYSGDSNNLTSTSNSLVEIAAIPGAVSTSYDYDAAGRLRHVDTVGGTNQ